MKTVLTIAGSDCSGGAGIQADIKAISANGAFAMSAITALTAQNTLGVSEIVEVSPEFVSKQIDAVFEDIRPDAVKIGMVSSSEIVEAISSRLIFHKADNIVLDPVMVATSGADLMKNNTVKALAEKLIPICDLITPNFSEAEVLSEITIKNEEDMMKAAEKLFEKYNVNVLLKGGHSNNNANDLFYSKTKIIWFSGEKIDNPNTHGTGCTLSSAIAANLAKGYEIEKAIELAKDYLTGAIKSGLNLGKGRGPLNHFFNK